MAGPQSSYSFRGLQTAHQLGMSWKSIILIVTLVVLAFGLFTFFMYKNGQKNNAAMQQSIDAQIQQATRAAELEAQQRQLQIQKQIEENVRKSQAGN